MSTKSLAKSHDEFLWDFIDDYRNQYGGLFRMEEVAQWILDNGLLPEPRISATRLLTQKLKSAARRRRFRDPQGRTVRKILAAKIERVDENGNLIMDVVWEYLHEANVDFGLTAFSQRDDLFLKQRLAATRDVHSFLDNNPNAAGHEDQFKFGFMVEEPVEIVDEEITETIAPQPLSQPGERRNELLAKKKPR